MTRPDIGSERPGQPSETRQWAEDVRADDVRRETNELTGRRFWLAVGVILAVLAGFAVALYLR